MPQTTILAFQSLCQDVSIDELPRCWEEFDRELVLKALNHPELEEHLIHLTAKDVKTVHESLKITRRECGGTLPTVSPNSRAAREVIKQIPFSLNPLRRDILVTGISGVNAEMGPQLPAGYHEETASTSSAEVPLQSEPQQQQAPSNPNPKTTQLKRIHILEAELDYLKAQFSHMQDSLIVSDPKIVMQSVSTIRDILYAVSLMLEFNFEGMSFMDRLGVIRHELRIPGMQLDLRTMIQKEQEQANVRLVGDLDMYDSTPENDW